MSLTIVLLAGLFVGLPALLALASLVGTAALERRYPPHGRVLALGDERLHVVELGPADAPALVLIHGASGNYRDLSIPVGENLARRFRVILVDRPGHGASPRRSRALAAPDAQAALIAEGLRSIGVERAVIVGHSLGAAVAASFAVLAPERARGLVLIAPATHPWPGGGISRHNTLIAMPVIGPILSWIIPFPVGSLVIRRVIPMVFRPDPVPADYEGRIGARLVLRPAAFRANAEDVAALLGNVTRFSPRYREIRAPTLVIEAAHDPIVRNDLHAAGIVRDVAGARLVTVETGHMPHWTAADRVRGEIERFADGL